jgi:hypothetical protein
MHRTGTLLLRDSECIARSSDAFGLTSAGSAAVDAIVVSEICLLWTQLPVGQQIINIAPSCAAAQIKKLSTPGLAWKYTACLVTVMRAAMKATAVAGQSNSVVAQARHQVSSGPPGQVAPVAAFDHRSDPCAGLSGGCGSRWPLLW